MNQGPENVDKKAPSPPSWDEIEIDDNMPSTSSCSPPSFSTHLNPSTDLEKLLAFLDQKLGGTNEDDLNCNVRKTIRDNRSKP